MSHKLSCLKSSLLNEEAATFLSVPFRVVTVGFKDSFHIFLHPFLAYTAERWYLLKNGFMIKKFLCLLAS